MDLLRTCLPLGYHAFADAEVCREVANAHPLGFSEGTDFATAPDLDRGGHANLSVGGSRYSLDPLGGDFFVFLQEGCKDRVISG